MSSFEKFFAELVKINGWYDMIALAIADQGWASVDDINDTEALGDFAHALEQRGIPQGDIDMAIAEAGLVRAGRRLIMEKHAPREGEWWYASPHWTVGVYMVKIIDLGGLHGVYRVGGEVRTEPIGSFDLQEQISE